MPILLPGWTQDRTVIGSGGLDVQQSAPARGVVHTTEGSFDSAMSVFRSRLAAPQLMMEPWPDGRKVQLIDLSRNGYALKRNGAQATNGMGHCAQIELVGYAGQAHTWPTSWLENVADMVKQVSDALGIRVWGETCYGAGAGWILASPYARQRYSAAKWAGFDAWCGHQHVPGNDHWNPGGLDLPRICEMAQGAPIPDFRELLEDNMAEFVLKKKGTAGALHVVTDGSGTQLTKLQTPRVVSFYTKSKTRGGLGLKLYEADDTSHSRLLEELQKNEVRPVKLVDATASTR